MNLRRLLEALPDANLESTDLYSPLIPHAGSGKSAAHPLVGIVMGSDSDLPTILPGARVLDAFGVHPGGSLRWLPSFVSFVLPRAAHG